MILKHLIIRLVREASDSMWGGFYVRRPMRATSRAVQYAKDIVVLGQREASHVCAEIGRRVVSMVCTLWWLVLIISRWSKGILAADNGYVGGIMCRDAANTSSGLIRRESRLAVRPGA